MITSTFCSHAKRNSPSRHPAQPEGDGQHRQRRPEVRASHAEARAHQHQSEHDPTEILEHHGDCDRPVRVQSLLRPALDRQQQPQEARRRGRRRRPLLLHRHEVRDRLAQQHRGQGQRETARPQSPSPRAERRRQPRAGAEPSERRLPRHRHLKR
jgi:hypothetical protein